MNIHFFDDPNYIPQPKDKVRIEALDIIPYPDRFRVHVHIKVTPFLERPNLILVAHNAQDRVVSELNIIETMHTDMEFTLHIRGVQEPAGAYTLTAMLFYESKNPPQDQRIEAFLIPEASESNEH
ncbi:MAG: hypothetical protein HXY40_06190 [Chloroflexi bacterium]|nr:hypothetical protein [Chloroflexota bacterium]